MKADSLLPPIAQRPTFLVHRLNAELARICNPLFRRLDVDLITSRILAVLFERERVNVGDLVALMSLPQSTVSHQIRRLSERGLVERRPDAADNRAYVLTLTRSGRTTARKCQAISEAVYAEVFADYDEASLGVLTSALTRMHESLQAMQPLHARASDGEPS